MIQNPDKTPVANDIFTYCTREKTDTWHVVRNHNALGIVDRVVCKACGSEHKYRPKVQTSPSSSSPRTLVRRAGGTLSPATPKSAAARTSSSKSLEDIWFEGIKKWGEKPVSSFDPTHHFLAGDVFQHPSFGKGVVQIRRENKIDVLFPNGIQKTLPSK